MPRSFFDVTREIRMPVSKPIYYYRKNILHKMT